MDKHYQVFINSTHTDLQEGRTGLYYQLWHKIENWERIGGEK